MSDDPNNNVPLQPNGDNSPITPDVDLNNSNINTREEQKPADFSTNKSVHPTSGSIKDSHGIDTSVFAKGQTKTDGPRVAQAVEKTAIHATAFNTEHEKVEKLKVDENKPEKSKTGLIVFLILLCAFVMFLPNITSIVNKFMDGKDNQNITEGELRCSMNKVTNNFDITYENNIPFSNNKLNSLKYVVTTKGDANKDASELEEIDATCNRLSEIASTIEGIEVTCEFVGNKTVENQNIDYSIVDVTKLKSAYSETGGTYPEFEYQEDINDVQRQLQAAGYTCTKIK